MRIFGVRNDEVRKKLLKGAQWGQRILSAVTNPEYPMTLYLAVLGGGTIFAGNYSAKCRQEAVKHRTIMT